ncbi:MAG: MFS transporter [Candidatus Pacebacteria bacterium]|nr:MFS transporter [Candidatus Paceibacterota bacterium]
MFFIPKIEKITMDATIVHFFLLFGYKTFSLYFPLFLVTRGLSLPEVGYAFLLIYLPLALFAPIAGFLNHKINPAILSAIGIFGYALYALGMILIQNQALFYFWQVLLGVSAALFFVSIRSILMGFPLENADRSFGWFYSAPFYADAIAPAIGAFFVWQFNFVGVFILSMALHLFTAFFCFFKLRKPARTLTDAGFKVRDSQNNYQKIFQLLKKRSILPFLLISFSVLLLAGFYHAFFVLFLKEQLVWSQNLILIFISVFSVLFLPLSFLLIKYLEKSNSRASIFRGGLIAGLLSIVFGLASGFLNFFSVLLINVLRSAGALICNSGRSGLVSRSFKTEPEEASAIDTVFAPLGVALGALVSGLLIGFLGYDLVFIFGGIFVVIVVLIVGIFVKRRELR